MTAIPRKFVSSGGSHVTIDQHGRAVSFVSEFDMGTYKNFSITTEFIPEKLVLVFEPYSEANQRTTKRELKLRELPMTKWVEERGWVYADESWRQKDYEIYCEQGLTPEERQLKNQPPAPDGTDLEMNRGVMVVGRKGAGEVHDQNMLFEIDPDTKDAAQYQCGMDFRVVTEYGEESSVKIKADIKPVTAETKDEDAQKEPDRPKW